MRDQYSITKSSDTTYVLHTLRSWTHISPTGWIKNSSFFWQMHTTKSSQTNGNVKWSSHPTLQRECLISILALIWWMMQLHVVLIITMSLQNLSPGMDYLRNTGQSGSQSSQSTCHWNQVYSVKTPALIGHSSQYFLELQFAEACW